MAIGEELLDVPFSDLVRSLGVAIAEGQLALDRAAIETMRALAREQVDVIPEVTEVIAQSVSDVEVDGRKVPVTGVTVTASGAAPVRMNLLQLGLQPTFYQFTTADIEVRMSITIRRTAESEPGAAQDSGAPRRALPVRAFASSVNYRTSNTYSYSAEGSSLLRATLRPVPAPPRVVPAAVTVNTLTTPPTVTRTP